MRDLHTLDKYRQKDHERKFYGCDGDHGNGCFKVYVNNHPFCLHLWRPNTAGDEIALPPIPFV